MSDSLGIKAVKGTIWSAFDRFGVMILQFIVNVVLARLLSPADFGSIGMLMIFLMVSQVFVDGGFGSALIQKKFPSEKDYSTIFFWNLGIGILLYLFLFLTSPLIAKFYRMPGLALILRVIGLTLIFSCIANIQSNRLQKRLQFKHIAISNISSYFIAGGFGILMALKGFGVWSLVVMMLVQGVGRILWLFIISRWIPKLIFSIESFRQLFSFGGYLFFSNLLETVCKNLQGLIIGKYFSASQMGYYSQAYKLDNITSCSIPQVIAGVMYPIFSQFQEDKEKLNDLIIRNIGMISFMVYPMLSILIIEAFPIINLLYGKQWLPSVPYYQILCIGGFFLCLNNIPYYAVAACGKSKALFLTSFYKWGALVIFLIVGMHFGMIGIIWSLSASIANIFIINLLLAKKYIRLKIKEVIKTILSSLFLISLSIIIIIAFRSIANVYWLLEICIFIFTYCGLALLFRIKTLNNCIILISKLFNKKLN